jgi:hypothetical protein
MSPEQLRTLQKLNRLFEDGRAGPRQIKELSELFATINKNHDIHENFELPKVLQNHSFNNL